MTTFRQLSRSLRLVIAAPWLLIAAAAALGSAPAFRQLLLNPTTNQPASTVSLSGANWSGTLDTARLPADVVVGSSLTAPTVNTDSLQVSSGLSSDGGQFYSDGYGHLQAGYVTTNDGMLAYGLISAFGGVTCQGFAEFDGQLDSANVLFAAGDGVILFSPNNFGYQLRVSDDGVLSASPYSY